MAQIGMTGSGEAWTSLGELQRAERRVARARVAGIALFALGLALGVILMDRAMPTDRAAAERAMAAPTLD